MPTDFEISTRGHTNLHSIFQGLSGELQGYFKVFQGFFEDNFTQSPVCNHNEV